MAKAPRRRAAPRARKATTAPFAPPATEISSELARLRTALDLARGQVTTQEKAIIELSARLEEARRVQEHLEGRLGAMDGDNRKLSERFVQLEEQATKFAFLYSASHQLLESLDRSVLVSAIAETVINIVGSEEFALYELDAASGEHRQIASMGAEAAHARTLRAGEGPLGALVARGLPELAGPGVPGPAAFVPLRRDGAIAGALVIFRLLPHKAGFEAVDREIFNLLGAHAARALYCAGLHEKLGVAPAGCAQAREAVA